MAGLLRPPRSAEAADLEVMVSSQYSRSTFRTALFIRELAREKFLQLMCRIDQGPG